MIVSIFFIIGWLENSEKKLIKKKRKFFEKIKHEYFTQTKK